MFIRLLCSPTEPKAHGYYLALRERHPTRLLMKGAVSRTLHPEWFTHPDDMMRVVPDNYINVVIGDEHEARACWTPKKVNVLITGEPSPEATPNNYNGYAQVIATSHEAETALKGLGVRAYFMLPSACAKLFDDEKVEESA